MDHRHNSSHREPRREHRSREWSERGSQDRDSRPRDSRSRSPKRAKTSSSRRDRLSEESSRHHKSSKHRSSHRHREHASRTADARVSADLPFSARQLSKLDLETFEPVFANYLSLQKQKEIEDMDDREVKGRWKSFVGKWNRGELAEGWYDPEMFARATAEDSGYSRRTYLKAKDDVGHDMDNDMDNDNGEQKRDGSDEDDDYGPVLPTSASNRRSGPGIPTLQDLSLRAELDEEDKEASIAALREARKADRTLQKERLDELVPRAEAGTRERKLEKRQMVNEKMRSFRDKSPGMEAGNEQQIMGGGDSIEEYKRAKQNEQRRKTEREIRREEVDRAKREEMEERRKAWKEREDGTVGMLRELARQRFG